MHFTAVSYATVVLLKALDKTEPIRGWRNEESFYFKTH